jgi:hypothetical protein
MKQQGQQDKGLRIKVNKSTSDQKNNSTKKDSPEQLSLGL